MEISWCRLHRASFHPEVSVVNNHGDLHFPDEDAEANRVQELVQGLRQEPRIGARSSPSWPLDCLPAEIWLP